MGILSGKNVTERSVMQMTAVYSRVLCYIRKDEEEPSF